MKITGPEAVMRLSEQLTVSVGRHLYAVLGSYEQLHRFEEDALAHGTDSVGVPFPPPVNVNRDLLARIEDEDLNRLVKHEAKGPHAITQRLQKELIGLVKERLDQQSLLILRQLELVFAYNLDPGVFRTQATDRSHIVLLIPGRREGDNVILFGDDEPRFECRLPYNLVTEDHLWELSDDKV